MNLDELQSIQSRERQASQLQHLRASFYEEVGRYIGELREQRNQVAAESDNPFDDPDVEQISDEIRTAERTVESIYERRVGKVVKLASIAAADMPHDDDGLTNEEERLFETLVDAIEGNRETVLSVLDGGTAALDCTPATDVDETSTDTIDATGTRSGSDGPSGHRNTPAEQGAPDAGSSTEADPDAGRTPGSGPDPATDRPTPPDRPAEEHPSAATGAVADETGPPAGEESLDIAGAMGGSSGGSDNQEEPAAGSGSGTGAAPSPAPGTGTGTGTGTGGGGGGERPTAADRGGRDDPAFVGDPEATGEAGGLDDSVEEGPIDRTTVRVTVDVGDIYGVDGRSYDLSAEDVVTLPTQNAEGLVSKDAAERLD